jgi:Tfp pilus assembly protein PilF
MAASAATRCSRALRLLFLSVLACGVGSCVKREVSAEDRLRAHALVTVGVHLAQEGKIDSARVILERAVSYDSTNAEALYRLGMVDEYLLQPELAETRYRQALRHDSLFGVVHLNLGQLCGRTGRYDEALRQFEAALRTDTARQVRALTYYCIGLTRGIQGNSAEAAEAYKSAVKLDTVFGRAYVGAGQELIRLGRHEEAVPILERAIAVDSTLYEAYSHLASSYRMLGRMDEAAFVEEASKRIRAARRMQR